MDGVWYSRVFAPALRSPTPPLSICRACSVSFTHSRSGSKSQTTASRHTIRLTRTEQRQNLATSTATGRSTCWLRLCESSHSASAYSCTNAHQVSPPEAHCAEARIGPHSSVPNVVCGSLYRPQTTPRHHALPTLYAPGAATAFHPAFIRCCATSVRVQLGRQLVPKTEQFRDAVSRRAIQVGPRESVGPRRSCSGERQRGHGQWIECSHAI